MLLIKVFKAQVDGGESRSKKTILHQQYAYVNFFKSKGSKKFKGLHRYSTTRYLVGTKVRYIFAP